MASMEKQSRTFFNPPRNHFNYGIIFVKELMFLIRL